MKRERKKIKRKRGSEKERMNFGAQILSLSVAHRTKSRRKAFKSTSPQEINKKKKIQKSSFLLRFRAYAMLK